MNRNENPPSSRGGKRMRELGAAAEIERVKLEADILGDLGAEPSTLHRIAAEALSSAVINGRRTRASGRRDNESLKLIAQLMRASGLRPPPAAPAEDTSPYGLLLDLDDGESAE
jgi:hypothetical protein